MIVLDASVTLKWFASEPGSAEARSLVHSDEELIAPELIQVEVASALVKKAIRQQLSLEEAQEALTLWFEAINDGDIVLLPDGDDLVAASELALQLAHPLADCLYLALAERLGVASRPIGPSFVARNDARHWFSSSRRRGAAAALPLAGGWRRSSAVSSGCSAGSMRANTRSSASSGCAVIARLAGRPGAPAILAESGAATGRSR